MSARDRQARLERSAAVVDKTNGVEFLVQPRIENQHAGHKPDPDREVFQCIGLLDQSNASAERIGFPGRDQDSAFRVGRSRARIRWSLLPSREAIKVGDHVEVTTVGLVGRFKVADVDVNNPVRAIVHLTKRG